MRWLPLEESAIGATLAKPVLSDKGGTLVKAGTVLTRAYVASLTRRGITSVAIEDPSTSDIVIEDVVSDETRNAATASVNKAFDIIFVGAKGIGNGDVQAAAAAIDSAEMQRLTMSVQVGELFNVADEVVKDSLDSARHIGSLTYFKTQQTYPVNHAIDAAIIAVMIGERLRLKFPDLKRLARGCLLRDIGNVFIGEETLNKTSPLTPEELKTIRNHTINGYKLLRQLNKDDFVANHVAFQHHERQDGTGYPRGIRGMNKMLKEEQRVPGNIHVLAEICAVADVYDSLVCERSFRPAMRPEVAVAQIQKISGGHLNRDIVDALFSVLPVYPIGVDIRFTEGRLKGFAGVVAKINPLRLDRPVVRILSDPRRQPVKPVDVDLHAYPDFKIETVPPKPVAPPSGDLESDPIVTVDVDEKVESR